jgi:hypothetical protein
VDILVHAVQFIGSYGERSKTTPAAVRGSSHGGPNRREDLATVSAKEKIGFGQKAGETGQYLSD